MQYQWPSYPPSWSFVAGVIELGGANVASMRGGGPKVLVNIAHSSQMYFASETGTV